MMIGSRAVRMKIFRTKCRAHLDLETTRLIDEGMSPADARAAARKAFGNVMAAQERFHESTRWVWLEQFVRDLRYGARTLWQSPAFLLTTVLTLTVALSLVTVAFAIFNAYVLRPFAVTDPATLHRVAWRAPDSGGQQYRWQDFEELRLERPAIFPSVIAEDMRLVSSDGRPLAVSFVSDNYFESLAPRMLLGRGLGPMDAHAHAAVLSHQAWSRIFAADPAALGREIELDGRRFTIVGILRPQFTGLDEYPRDAWVPYSTYRDMRPLPAGTLPARDVEMVVRLQPDARDHVGQIFLAHGTDAAQRREVALGQQIEMRDQRRHRGIEAVELLELDGEALREIARAYAGRIEPLHDRQHGLDLGDRRAELFPDHREIAAEVAGLIDHIDQVLPDHAPCGVRDRERELLGEMIGKCGLGRDEGFEIVVGVVAAAGAGAGPLGIAGHGVAVRTRGRCVGVGGRNIVEVGCDSSLSRRTIVAVPVALCPIRDRWRIRRRRSSAIGGATVPIPFALDALQQRIALELPLHIGGEVEIGELQQLDGLHQLRRHHERMALPNLKSLGKRHFALNWRAGGMAVCHSSRKPAASIGPILAYPVPAPVYTNSMQLQLIGDGNPE